MIISKQTPGAGCLSTLLTASLTPFEAFDAVLDDLKPNKIKDEVVVKSQIPRLKLTATGYVGSFDGAVRTKDPISGAYSSIIFELPSWKIVGIRGGYKPGLTVNESEYHGLIQTLTMARQLGIEELLVFGDSRIALHQVTGLLRCHKSNLELLLNQVKTLQLQFRSIQFFHVFRHFNQSADYMATKTLKIQADVVEVAVEEQKKISGINRLPELLYSKECLTQSKCISAILFAMRKRSRENDDNGGNSKKRRTRSSNNQSEHVQVEAEIRQEIPEDANHSAPSSLSLSDVDPSLAQVERLKRIAIAQNDELWMKELKGFILGRAEDFDHDRIKKLAKMAELFVLDRYEVLYYHPSHVMSANGPMRLVVPIGMRKDILRTYHDELAAGAHSGVTKTYEKIKRFYYWRGMYADIEAYILTCSDCCSAKGKPRFAGKSPGNIVPTRPMQVVSMDFIIPLPETHDGNTAILIFTCAFCGLIISVAMRSTTAMDVAEAYLNNVFRRYGASEVIRHDRDPRFMSKVFKAFNRMMRQQQRATLAYRPQANGQQERYVQIIVRAIRVYIEDVDQKDWDQYLVRLEFALNNSIHNGIGYSTFYLAHGWQARSTVEAMVPAVDKSAKELDALKWRKRIARQHTYALAHAADIHKRLKEERAKIHNEALDSMLERRNRGKVVTEYAENSLVWVYFDLVKPKNSKKLAHLWHGPYPISKKINDYTYELDLSMSKERFHKRVHVSRLKPFNTQLDRPSERLNEDILDHTFDFDEALLPEDSFEPDSCENEYEVEEILDDKWERKSRTGRRQHKYLVSWKGYGSKDNSWVDENDLSCGALLYEYDKKKQRYSRFLQTQSADEDL